MASHYILIAFLLFFPAVMAMAGSMDLLTMTIPNRLCLALAVGYFVLAVALGAPWHGVLLNASCGFVVLLVMFSMFTLGWIGGGDAKLAAATALWLGWGSLLDYGVSAAIYGGVLTVVLILGRKMTLPAWMSKQEWIARLHNPRTGVPYGIALAAAGIMIYPETSFWHAAALT